MVFSRPINRKKERVDVMNFNGSLFTDMNTKELQTANGGGPVSIIVSFAIGLIASEVVNEVVERSTGQDIRDWVSNGMDSLVNSNYDGSKNSSETSYLPGRWAN